MLCTFQKPIIVLVLLPRTSIFLSVWLSCSFYQSHSSLSFEVTLEGHNTVVVKSSNADSVTGFLIQDRVVILVPPGGLEDRQRITFSLVLTLQPVPHG